MFNAIRGLFRRAQCEVAFAKEERAAKKRHFEQAASLFDTSAMDDQIQQLQVSIEQAASRKFGTQLSNALREERAAASAYRDAEEKYRLLHRDFKSELAPLYDELNKIKTRISEAYAEKSNAYDRLDSAKSSLNSWYNRSERTFFGNGGKKLPEQAWFGQDLSDRDYYKRSRDNAASDIDIAKRKINSLRRQKADVGKQIGAIKEARKAMFALRDEGLNRKTSERHLSKTAQSAATKANARRAVEKLRCDFLHECQLQCGLPSLISKVKRKISDRKDFELRFDHTSERAARKKRFEEMFYGNHRS